MQALIFFIVLCTVGHPVKDPIIFQHPKKQQK